MESVALRYHEFGPAADVLRLERWVLPAPSPGEVRLRLRAAALHPSDLGMIGGVYGRLLELPATAGREGVGEVAEAAPDVAAAWPAGTRVYWPRGLGAWQDGAVAPADALERVPAALKDADAALAGVNPPTAVRLLADFGPLPAGAWVAQNAANSAVGLHVIQLARHLGLRTLNLVRRPELAEPLLAAGADRVVLDTDEAVKAAAKELAGADVRLALNSVGGPSALRLLRFLRPGGTHVTFGAADFEPVRWPTRQLIFDRLTLTGFWLDHWQRTAPPAARAELRARVEELFAAGVFRAEVAARFPLAQFREALAAAAQPRFGKVLLVP